MLRGDVDGDTEGVSMLVAVSAPHAPRRTHAPRTPLRMRRRAQVTSALPARLVLDSLSTNARRRGVSRSRFGSGCSSTRHLRRQLWLPLWSRPRTGRALPAARPEQR